MICSICGKEISDEAIVCPECRSRVAELDAEKKLSETRARASAKLSEIFKTPVFIVLMVSLAVYALSAVIITALSLKNGIGVIGDVIFTLIPGIFAGISAFGAYNLYRSPSADGMNIKKLEEYPRVAGGYHLAYTIIFGICAALILLGTAALFSMLSSVGDLNAFFDEIMMSSGMFTEAELAEMETAIGILEGVLAIGLPIIMALVLVISGAVLTLMIFSVITYKKTRKYYGMLSNTAVGQSFDRSMKIPSVCLYIFGTLEILSGLTSIASNIFIMFSSLGAGVYLVATAILLENIKREETKIADEIEAADAALADIRVKTNSELRRMVTEEDAEEAKAEAEAPADEEAEPAENTEEKTDE